MSSKNSFLSGDIEAFLSSEASPEEVEALGLETAKGKPPTRLTVILEALYKKAAGGDLTAIKELLCRMSPEEREERGVIFIDDIKNKVK